MEKKGTLKTHGIGMFVLLILQYVLGMITNLLIEFPQGVNVGQSWEFAWKQLPLAAHIILGLLLIIGAIVLVIRSALQKNKSWLMISSVGAIAILLAGVSGASFIPTQQALYSFVMSISFMIALISYGLGIYAF